MPKKPAKGTSYILMVVVLGILIFAGTAVFLRTWYNHNLSAVSSSTSRQYFTVHQGTSAHQIGLDLYQASLIRNASAFETYVTTNNYRDKLQAGTYGLSPSMNVQTIVNKMVKGDVARDLLTILPGKRLDQIKQAFKNAGYTESEIEDAFNPANYSDMPVMANLPRGSTLEGLLYPDSFQKQSGTPAKTIVRESLEEMQKQLTNDVAQGFGLQGLSVYQGLALASIVTQESGDPAVQPKVAQVFLLRMKQGMALQSDVTANYAADMAGVTRSVFINSPYNTYQHKGLPPGPISNVTASALKAVAHPATTTYLYFIAGDDGKVYFSYTAEQHQALIKKYCQKGCYQ